MNYKKLYDKIIENRQQNPINEGYSENHHIVPKSLGGSDDLDNLVKLSAREHFICHYLLAKMYKKETFEWYKMNHAFMMMKNFSLNQERYFNSRLYEALRGDFSVLMSFAQKGENNSQYGTCWICHIEKKENKKIPMQDLELWETKGWVKGRNVWNREVECASCKVKFIQLKTETVCGNIVCKEKLSSQRIFSTESRRKISESKLGGSHQNGKKNSQFGTCWVNDGVNIKKIKKKS